jgi:chemotaxis protein CheX
MRIKEEQIDALMQDVWSSLSTMPIVRTPARTFEEGTRLLTGCVQITGGWWSAVSVQCSLAFARGAASSLFGLEASALTDAEAREALGELVNIVGGNLKALMPGTSQLSLPLVAEGGQLHFIGAELEDQVWMDCAGQPIVISVFVWGNEDEDALAQPAAE